ncbi:hemin transporter associated protein [Corynebacterium diphtheriae]|uniref:HtaA domain-containing protein n=1 Tax=Corynebacterium diphtheriae TaxID=1717 RepID=UPI00086E0870|nr:HtaA domain-containing protein [Corynebacterium diphtheriae]ODS19051.1 hemin receptor [Corynebacterium diphtheriae]ONF68363.1 hemin receptor [Corynebacterium diphtheriae]RLP14367.1 hemin receptor [Corynebacterium diphtheriae]CAB0513230.1 hemin transporter associated protein [Corynebacterium diphtheriae]CAB0608150.1 hemin transporter associated protein [Corynebacterium diphtheriae]
MKNQRLRHILTTTVACATLTSLVSPQAFAERVVEDAANDSAIVTTDNDQGSTVSEEATADDVTDGKNDPKGLAETVKEIEDVSDKAITAGEKAVSLKDAEDRKDPANAADAKSTGETLTWGVRSSFNNYSGGPTEMLDGAKQNGTKNRFTFQLESVTYDEATEKLEAKFKGGVHYQKYCADEASHFDCQLDLKIENPRIVIAKGGSHVFAKVSSKKYQSSGTYTNDGEDDARPIAQLYTANATFKEEGDKVTWSEIPALLTKDGAEMFSNFYPINSGLDSLTFSFKKSQLGDKSNTYKRLSTDNAKYLVSSEKFDDKGLYEHHRELFKYKDSIVVASAHSRFKDHDKAGFAFLDRNLKEKSFKHADLNGYGAIAFDEDKGDLYYTARKKTESGNRWDEDPTRLYKLHVDANKGFTGEPTLVHTFADDITAVGYNPATKDVAVVTKKQTAVVNKSEIKPVNLPEQDKLVQGTDFSSPSNLYGAALYNSETSELLPMNDGSFILNGDTSSAKKKTGGEEKTVKGLMVSIDPKRADAPAKLLAESATEFLGISSNAAHTDGETIVRYNKNTYKDNAVAQAFTFKNGSLTKVSTGDVVKGSESDVENWGNAIITDTGALMALDSKDGKLKHVALTNFKRVQDEKPDEYGRKTEDVAIPQGAKTGTHQHGAILQLDKGTFYVPSFDDEAGESNEVYVLRKVYDPKFFPQSQESERESSDSNNGGNSDQGTLSKPWKIILGTFGALGGILGLLGAVHHFFGGYIRGLLEQLNIRL